MFQQTLSVNVVSVRIRYKIAQIKIPTPQNCYSQNCQARSCYITKLLNNKIATATNCYIIKLLLLLNCYITKLLLLHNCYCYKIVTVTKLLQNC
jgi:hypothetical protein